jgi:ribosomal-protein-alanine N-acetyltransferase
MIRIESLAAADLDAVSELEQVAGDVHWSREQFERELKKPFSRFFVLRDGNDIVGYGGYWKAGDEAQIANLVVRLEYRRRGFGQRLLSSLLEHASSEGCGRSTLEVRSANLAALRLYEKESFVAVGLRKKIYINPVDDAVLMEKRL